MMIDNYDEIEWLQAELNSKDIIEVRYIAENDYGLSRDEIIYLDKVVLIDKLISIELRNMYK